MPKCGSLKKEIIMKIVESLDIKEILKGEINDKGYNSKKNPRYEFLKGDDILEVVSISHTILPVPFCCKSESS